MVRDFFCRCRGASASLESMGAQRYARPMMTSFPLNCPDFWIGLAVLYWVRKLIDELTIFRSTASDAASPAPPQEIVNLDAHILT